MSALPDSKTRAAVELYESALRLVAIAGIIPGHELAAEWLLEQAREPSTDQPGRVVLVAIATLIKLNAG
jgi:hypothetical protein